MSFQGIGVDVVEIKRFRDVRGRAGARFISNVFTEKEREYCRAFKDSASHFAGVFAAKEAIQKAVGAGQLPLSAIEIRHERSGRPVVWLKGKRHSSILISISHTKAIACAVAIVCN